MAARSSWYHHHSSTMAMISPKLGTRKAAPFRFSISAHGSSSSSHRSFAAAADKKKKVFEDHLRGMVCYRDEKGEMICEGYDEGPRFGMPLPEKVSASHGLWEFRSMISSIWPRSRLSRTLMLFSSRVNG